MSSPPPAAIVLAAGASSRLGQPKQLVSLAGESLVRRTARLALEAGCAPVLVVCGSEAERVRAEVADLDVTPVHNPAWREGLAASIRAGIAALPAECPAVLLLACDQPALDGTLLFELLGARRTNALVACEYAGGPGIPAVFPRALFGELLGLQGDRGARALLQARRSELALVRFVGGEQDLDTPADLARWRAKA